MITVVFASDHAGFELKDALIEGLRGQGAFRVVDLGPMTPDRCDYPDYAAKVARQVAAGDADFGVLVCGSGIGMSIAANKVPGARAALVHDELGPPRAAAQRRPHVRLGSRLLGPLTAERALGGLPAGHLRGRTPRRSQVAKIHALDGALRTLRSAAPRTPGPGTRAMCGSELDAPSALRRPRAPLHHLRAHRDALAGGQAGRSARSLDNNKIRAGVEVACSKRPVPVRSDVDAFLAGIERHFMDSTEREVTTERVGETVLKLAAHARRGGLRPVRLGVPRVHRRAAVPDRAGGSPGSQGR
ncbi:MAG: RpiB/LacA/LacB family sugar-phosphate isomerase [bacterium]